MFAECSLNVEWLVMVQFAEPCIIECHDGEEQCNACITAAGGSHAVHAMHAMHRNITNT
jgi:hypothetical protein